MQELSLFSQISFYFLIALIGLYGILVFVWQVFILKGKSMNNPDGSTDDWKKQKTHYGIAIADIFLACPSIIIGFILVFFNFRWGCYLLSLVSFWFVWANIMTTATSLRFENPKLTFSWFFTFPFGALLGLAYIVWTFINFEIIYI